MNLQANALRQAGIVAFRAGRLEEAMRCFQQSSAFEPESYDTYAYLGAVYARMKNFESARRAFGRAVQLQPQSPKSRFNLGSAHQMAGDEDAARACFEMALELDPDYTQAKEALARIPPRVATMSQLATPGGSMHLPGAQTSELAEEEPAAVVSSMTPEEIARLSMPEGGHLHMMGAQVPEADWATAHHAPEEKDEDEPVKPAASHLTPAEIAKLAFGDAHIHIMGPQAAGENEPAPAAEAGVEEVEGPKVSSLTPEEIARLSLPEGGHIHMMGAQALEEDPEHVRDK